MTRTPDYVTCENIGPGLVRCCKAAEKSSRTLECVRAHDWLSDTCKNILSGLHILELGTLSGYQIEIWSHFLGVEIGKDTDHACEMNVRMMTRYNSCAITKPSHVAQPRLCPRSHRHCCN